MTEKTEDVVDIPDEVDDSVEPLDTESHDTVAQTEVKEEEMDTEEHSSQSEKGVSDFEKMFIVNRGRKRH